MLITTSKFPCEKKIIHIDFAVLNPYYTFEISKYIIMKKSVKKYFPPEGLSFQQRGNEIKVFSAKIQADPLFNRPYIKVQSKAIPQSRPTINDWFQKFTPNSI